MNDFSNFFEIIDQAPDAIIFSDPNGNIKLWNKMAEEIFGHQSSETVGQSLDIIIPERLRQAHWNAFHKAIRTGHTKYHGKSLTTKSIHRNGNTIYVKLTFSLVRNPQGEIEGALAFARDFTEEYLIKKGAKNEN